MEELIQNLQRICVEHLAMRVLLSEHKETSNVRRLCKLPHYRNAVRNQFRETLGDNLDTLPDEITASDLALALSATTLDAPLPPPENPSADVSWR